jgi:hypothetical protein
MPFWDILVVTVHRLSIPQKLSPSNLFLSSLRLNFYGFERLRSEGDLQTHTEAVRFSHPFFRKGRPDLLHRINRYTYRRQTEEVHESEVEAMQRKIDMLEREVHSLEEAMDQKLHQVTVSLTEDYLSRICALEASHQRLLQGIAQLIPSMAPSLTTPHLTPMPLSSAFAPATVSRNLTTSWPIPASPPPMGHLESILGSKFVWPKNQVL